VRQRVKVLALLRSAGPGRAVGYVLLTFVTALVPAALAASMGLLISRAALDESGDLSDAERGGLIAAVAVLAVVLLAERTLPMAVELLRVATSRAIDGARRSHVAQVLGANPGIGHLDAPKVQQNLGLLRGDFFGTPGVAAVSSVDVAARYVQTVSALAIVAWYSVPLAAATFAGIVVIRRRWQTAFSDLADAIIDGAINGARATYLAGLLLTARPAAEVRVFGLRTWIGDRQSSEWWSNTRPAVDVRARLRRSSRVELAGLAVLYGITFVLVCRDAAAGAIGLGLVAAILQAEFSAAQLIAPGEIDFATSAGIAAMRAMSEIEEVSQHRGPGADAVPDRVEEGITLRGVTFGYPRSTGRVLDRLDLALPAGRSTAIVGVNGAGKTSLVKLLCGFYVPDDGVIEVDGTDLAALDRAAWQAGVAAIFQDFIRYELSVRDNVVLGAWHNRDDDRAMARALQRAGAEDLVARLPQGLDTIVSKGYEGGHELSGGEWQRVALARAMFAVESGARLLVLDEPTANLDVRLEAELYERFFELTEGTTSVVISHRFATVRRADQIVVLDGGRITEQGDHDTLVQQGGEYARLFRIQAERFADDAIGSTGG
jgi:ATP-binding cassette subfamily B protein